MSSSFIVGASGYTGQYLVRLAARGGGALAHIRPGSSKQAHMESLCVEVGAELLSVPFDVRALGEALDAHRPTFVFACLGTTRRRASQEEGSSYETIDYGLTKMVMDACEHAEEPPHFVYLSALGAQRPTSNRYMAVRHRIENELRASSLSWSVVRPAFVTGSDRSDSRPMERLGATIGDGVLGTLAAFGAKNLRRKYASLSGEELAAAMLRVAKGDRAAGVCGVHEASDLRA